ncbi:peptidase M36, partial [Rozella allomycis CSF55]
YIITSDDTLRHVWDIELDIQDNWIRAQVCSSTQEILGLVDWVKYATYHVYPAGIADPLSGERTVEVDPEDEIASPKGWTTKINSVVQTRGNNVWAQENWEGENEWKSNHRPKVANNTFDFPISFTKSPKSYVDAAITNLFYWNNLLHDILYHYGFDERAGNFQDDNFGNGGKGGDAVIANAQDGSGTDNANFATPPDGRRPRMRMYIWDVTKPNRDGDLDSGVIIHEYFHG